MSDLGEVSRKLIAVFAADVEGYSRLMGADEVGTLRGLTERRVILDKLIADHRGRIANTAGSSVPAEFTPAFGSIADIAAISAGSAQSRMTHKRHWQAQMLNCLLKSSEV
jgi:adenylate cyclase